MKLFRVVYEEDGRTIKEPGIVETEIRETTLIYAAETFQRVLWEVEKFVLADPEKSLKSIAEVAPSVIVLKEE